VAAGRDAEELVAAIQALPGLTHDQRAAYALRLADAAVYVAAQARDRVERDEAEARRRETWAGQSAGLPRAVVTHPDPTWPATRQLVVTSVANGQIVARFGPAPTDSIGYSVRTGWSMGGASRIDVEQTLTAWREYCERRRAP
jgi:hypothetical protein